MKTVIFWGAGATATVGMRLTSQQASFIAALAAKDGLAAERVAKVRPTVDFMQQPLADLLHLLGDDVGPEKLYEISEAAKASLARQFAGLGVAEGVQLSHIHFLRGVYNWPALKLICHICPGWDTDRFQLNDLFNILDMHRQSGHGFAVGKDEFLTQQQIIGAYQALVLLLQSMFYIDYQIALRDGSKSQQLRLHYDFAEQLARRMQRQGLSIPVAELAKRSYFMGDVSFASLNYDPVSIWAQFTANHDVNNQANVPHVGVPCVPLKLFHELGHFMGARTLDNDNGKKDDLWYPMNETSAQRLNDPEYCTGRRVRLTKYLFPHGTLCWRECPSCGKLTANLGDRWELTSPTLIAPPPLPGFLVEEPSNGTLKEKQDWQLGRVDARQCVHCETMTYAHHACVVMQSSFKQRPPAFIEEIQHDLRNVVQQAEHIILFGYSLPKDDVIYRAFFAARQARNKEKIGAVRCSVVVGHTGADRWYDPGQIPSMAGEEANTLQAAKDIFGEENVRFYGGGIPAVFTQGDQCCPQKIDQLLNWTIAKP